jgi:hypothetical protein
MCVVTLWNDNPISVTPPNHVMLEVVDTDPGLKGDTAGTGGKPATIVSLAHYHETLGKSGKYPHYPVPVVSSFLIQAKCANILIAQAFSEFANIDILKTDFDDLKKIATAHDLCPDFEWIEDLQILLFTALCDTWQIW